eukprot:525873-Amphidinium_carterae.5
MFTLQERDIMIIHIMALIFRTSWSATFSFSSPGFRCLAQMTPNLSHCHCDYAGRSWTCTHTESSSAGKGMVAWMNIGRGTPGIGVWHVGVLHSSPDVPQLVSAFFNISEQFTREMHKTSRS